MVLVSCTLTKVKIDVNIEVKSKRLPHFKLSLKQIKNQIKLAVTIKIQ